MYMDVKMKTHARLELYSSADSRQHDQPVRFPRIPDVAAGLFCVLLARLLCIYQVHTYMRV